MYEDDIAIPEGSVRFLQLAAERSVSIGVRGEYTASYLEKMGIHNVEIIGCPSFYWHGEQGFQLKALPPAGGSGRKLSISVTRDRDMYGFTENLKQVHRALLNYAIQHDGAYIVQSNFSEALMSHHQSIEEDMLLNMLQYFQIPREQLEPFILKGVEIFFNTTEWQQFLQPFDATVGSRFHGGMMALISGVPALWITHDVRTRELCNYLGVAQLHIDEIVARQLSVDAMVDAIDYTGFTEHYQRRYQTYKAFLQANHLPLAF